MGAVTAGDPELFPELSNAGVKSCSVVQVDIVGSNAELVQQARSENMCPVDHIVGNRRLRVADAKELERVDCRVFLVSV